MTDQTSDEQTVRLLVEQLITAAGSYDLDTFEGMMGRQRQQRLGVLPRWRLEDVNHEC